MVPLEFCPVLYPVINWTLSGYMQAFSWWSLIHYTSANMATSNNNEEEEGEVEEEEF